MEPASTTCRRRRLAGTKPGAVPRSALARTLATALTAGLALTACTTVADRPPGSSAPVTTTVAGPSPGPADPMAPVREAVTAVFAQRATAVAARDKGAWQASVADTSSSFGAAQSALFDRLVSLPVSGLTARQVTLTPSPTNSTAPTATAPTATAPTSAEPPTVDGYVVNVVLAYRFAGYDQGDRSFAASYLVGRTADGWRLTGPGPGRTQPQPFDLDGATSVRSASTLVIGDVAPETLETYRAIGDAARDPIAAAWGQARPGVIVAPRTTAELEAQLGRGPFAGIDQVAAITDGPLATGEPAQSDRVYLNPDAVGRLSAQGRTIVITHELTHVTVRGSTTRPVPIWLSEGYADEVAYSASGLAPRTVAAALLIRVRDGRGPTQLPTASDFDPAKGPIDPTYNAAWLAALLIRDRFGPDRLTDFYRAVSGGPTADAAVTGSAADLTRAAFPAVLGETQDTFVTAWLDYLKQLAA